MNPNLSNVSLCCIDTTPKKLNGLRAIRKSMEQCDFGAVKFLTDDASLPYAVKIDPLHGMGAYSTFCIRDLYEYIDTSHLLIVQHDGYVLDGQAWMPEFLNYDYIGAPWDGGLVGNGGFSLRSRRLMEAAAYLPGNSHPEDAFLSRHHRRQIEAGGFKFAPTEVAKQFAIEGTSFEWRQRSWASDGRSYGGQFGFHSFLTPLPGISDRPKVFHHSGDLGDILYSLATVKALGGGVLYLSPDSRYPYPAPVRMRLDHGNSGYYTSFLEMQDYLWLAKYTHKLPQSTDHDLNKFREFYQQPNPSGFETLYQLHARAFGLTLDETKPWLQVDVKREFPERPIVISRTPRYRNPHFPWRRLIERYGNAMVFVGIESEYQMLVNEINVRPLPPWIPTNDLAELARVIAGAKVFIGNQSAPMALALGLGVPAIIQECWQANPNCVLRRPGALYWGIDTITNDLTIPENLLK